ncbi:hypothetical protein [Fervidibacillus halotolerans]|uniref:nSTAND3 domain-containing NTPase n=1 Tax=Fervidibacillus halotolerans TaxID=2980027 RepID=UPI003B847E6A
MNGNQKEIKKDIVSLLNQNEIKYVLIKGNPGTGKTLLTYNIAHEYIKGKKCSHYSQRKIV